MGKNVIGFNADMKARKERSIGEILSLVQPEDLVKFGMIPEFSGRVPVLGTLNELDRDELIRVLIEPKNALVRQYQKLFELENVKLHFPEETIEAIADLALDKDTGARGLRAIMEEAMMEIMFDIPSKKSVEECVITPGVIRSGEDPLLVYDTDVAVSDKSANDESATA